MHTRGTIVTFDRFTLHVSLGNTKTGRIPSVNMTPVRTCPGSSEGCRKDCYALKSYRQYPSVRTAWDDNADLFTDAPMVGAMMLIAWLERRRKLPRYFRLHSAGDLLGQVHLEAYQHVARLFPTITFYGYTKTHGLDMTGNPSNLVIRRSMWHDIDIPTDAGALLAWCRDGVETRIPDNAFTCPATAGRSITCEKCAACANAQRDVVFNLH